MFALNLTKDFALVIINCVKRPPQNHKGMKYDMFYHVINTQTARVELL